ncbi:hypothetical protein [Agaribacterium sp. ZY112]|uniref:hypothetical protein n=1 Tax=Agaribacterium sp. ZY112 TaxID=3233574 RepID=UPI003523A80D
MKIFVLFLLFVSFKTWSCIEFSKEQVNVNLPPNSTDVVYSGDNHNTRIHFLTSPIEFGKWASVCGIKMEGIRNGLFHRTSKGDATVSVFFPDDTDMACITIGKDETPVNEYLKTGFKCSI